MDYDFIVQADRFYSNSLPALFIGSVLLLFVCLFIVMYAKPKSKLKRWTPIVYLSILLLCIGYGLQRHHYRYGEWHEQQDAIHPGVRRFSYILGMQFFEDPQMVQLYQETATLANSLNQLSVYEGESIQNPFPYSYLGEAAGRHYFEINEYNVFYIEGDIEETSESSFIEATHYSLIDNRLESLGFVDGFAPVAEKVIVNENEIEQATNEWPTQTRNVTELELGWNFYSYNER